MRSVGQDVTYFLRTLVKAPGFFAVAVLTLALGIGANTAIFSVINSVLLRPLPFHDPDRLVRLFETEAAPGRYPFTGPDYLDWRAQNKTLESTALYAGTRRANLAAEGQAESAMLLPVEVSYFKVLGVRPFLGRTLLARDGVAGAARVAVLSHGFWQRHFAGDPGVIGRTIQLNSEPHTIVGVMRSDFDYPARTEVWTPLDMSPEGLGSRGAHRFQVLARLKTGVSVSQAQADLAVIARRLEQQYPDSNEKIGAAVVAMREQEIGTSREPLLILLGAVALVLLVACANVANLLLIRAGGRRRELAIRSALGAGRWRVARQLLTESLLLALAGGALGLGAAWWGVRLLRSAKALPIPVVNPVAIDGSVLLFTLGAALATGILFGILPAWQVSSARLSEELKSGSQTVLGAGTRARRLRDCIAVAEIALSLALLVGAGLLLRSFDKMRHADNGVNSDNVLTVAVSLPEVKYPTGVARRAFFDRLLDRTRSTPGVEAAAVATWIPLEGNASGYITVPGRDAAALRNQLFEFNFVTPDYFRAFGIPLLAGRTFTPQDENETAAVAARAAAIEEMPTRPANAFDGLSRPGIISRTMARVIWPGQDPIGKAFRMGGIMVRVVGVVGDVKGWRIRSDMMPRTYFALPAILESAGYHTLVVRTAGRPAALLAPIRGHLTALDSTLALLRPRTMEEVIADGMVDTSLQTWLLGAFAALALLLAAVGLYSVMAFLVAQRRKEIGIRMALGAGQRDLLRLVLGHAGRLVAAGLGLGLVASLGLTRLIRGLLFGVAANDPSTFAAVTGLLVLVALVACALPARRATRTDPIVALRCD